MRMCDCHVVHHWVVVLVFKCVYSYSSTVGLVPRYGMLEVTNYTPHTYIHTMNVRTGWKLWDWIRSRISKTRPRTPEQIKARLITRFNLAKQNLFTELLSSILLPVVVACELFYNHIGLGEPTITLGMSQNKILQLLFMYLVLLAAEVCNHVIVDWLLKKQWKQFKHKYSGNVVTVIPTSETGNVQRVRAFGEALSTTTSTTELGRLDDMWLRENAYWTKYFPYIFIVSFNGIVAVFYHTAFLRHRLFD